MPIIIPQTDIFEANTASTIGALNGDYLWSNPDNWSTGAPPVSGDNVSLSANGVDDIGSLSLTSLAEAGGGLLYAAAASLAVGTLDVAANFQFYAGILGDPAPATVTVASIVGAGGIVGAIGASAAFIDLAATDPGELYFAGYGGAVTLNAPPAATSTLEFNGIASNTIALENLAPATYAAALDGLATGNVLELPGTAVLAASFGASSLAITTSAGIFDFSNASYGNSVSGYIATEANGMAAIAFTGPDYFSDVVAASAGPFNGDYLWSNPNNWSSGATPVSGGSVIVQANGVDDIGALSLTSLAEGGGALLYAAGSSLVIGTLDVASNFQFYAGILGDPTPATVTVASIVGAGGVVGAIGSNASFIDLSATDPGEQYFAGYGGAVTLNAAPAATSILDFNDIDNSTIALENLAPGTYAAALQGLAPGNVLELPGTAVLAASIGASSLAITTSAGIFDFSNASYGNSVSGYIATQANGMEAVTLTGPEYFSHVVAASSGPFDGEYLWSNPDNWSTGATPVSGGSVVLDANGVDDLNALSLTSLAEAGSTLLYAAGSSLAIGTLDVASNFQFYAGILGDPSPATVTVASIVGAGGIVGAIGANAAFIDLAATDPGELYFAGYGGAVTLNAPPAATSTLEFNGIASNTIALENLAPGTYAAALQGLAPGNVLELPGTAVLAASFGASSLAITTSAGIFDFSNASYGNSVSGYIATQANGMAAVTLTGPEYFSHVVAASSGPFDGEYLWSNPNNWSTGATPVSGGSVVLDANGVDDLNALSLTSLAEAGSTLLYAAGSSLAIGTLDVASNFQFYAGILGDPTPATVTVASIVGAGGVVGAIGSNASFIDLSATDPGEQYFAGYGGAVTLNAPPAATSILDFNDINNSTIALENLAPGTYAAALQGLAPGNVLELPGTAVLAANFGTASLAITTSAGIFDFADAGYGNSVSGYIATQANGLEAITFTDVTCYVSGTNILTAAGERPVETLQIGDLLKTRHSGHQKIKWIGTRSYDGTFIEANTAALPICIKRGAIAENIPARDLFVSPGHAICLNGALIHASRLVNGVSITQAERVASVTYFHIEMENHEIIFAENCPAETFIGENFRPLFQNAGNFAAHYPGQTATEIPCLPQLGDGFRLRAIQNRINARAGIPLPHINTAQAQAA